MDGRPSESLMPLTRRLAEQLADDDGARVLAQLQVLGLVAAGTGVAGARATAPSLGIWGAARNDSGEIDLVRDPSLSRSWRFWADVERIGPKRGPRVVLLGESAARGYLYDPALTPAGVLGDMLDGIEVIDLAASDLPSAGLDSVIAGAPALSPDAIVLFAGNNWHNVQYGLDELQMLADALRQGGLAAVRVAMIERVVLPRARATLGALAATAKGIPVVVVVPEFALGEWRSEPVPAPLLPGGANLRWMRRRADAVRAREAGDADGAAAVARELIAIDGGTSSLPYELLGDAARARGDRAAARAAFEAARDAVFGTFVAHSPRCAGAVQNVLRASASVHGFAVVDLPRAFETELAGDLPDRRLFLDYCHLTALGMQVAMGAVADALAPRLNADRLPASPVIAADDESTAHFLAAIHNAHQGQPNELIRYHLGRAVALSSRALERIEWYLDLQAREAEQWMCASFDRLCDSPLVRRYFDATDPRVIGRFADGGLTAEMTAVLEAAGRVPPRDDGDAVPIDLLAPRHRARSFNDRAGHSFGPQRGYFRALDLVSRFAFHRANGATLRADLTCRLPGTGDEEEVAVRLNGTRVTTRTAGPRWRRFELEITARAGTNELEIEWPLREPRWAELIESDARRLERAVYPDALPAYGEIYSLTLTTRGVPSRP